MPKSKVYRDALRDQFLAALTQSGMTRAQFARSLVIRPPVRRGITPRQLRNLLDGTCAVQPEVLEAAGRLVKGSKRQG